MRNECCARTKRTLRVSLSTKDPLPWCLRPNATFNNISASKWRWCNRQIPGIALTMKKSKKLCNLSWEWRMIKPKNKISSRAEDYFQRKIFFMKLWDLMHCWKWCAKSVEPAAAVAMLRWITCVLTQRIETHNTKQKRYLLHSIRIYDFGFEMHVQDWRLSCTHSLSYFPPQWAHVSTFIAPLLITLASSPLSSLLGPPRASLPRASSVLMLSLTLLDFWLESGMCNHG